MALISGLSSALSGMRAAQAQIGLIGNNVSNADTVGYTRKTAQQISNVVAGSSVGVKLAPASRQVSQSLLRSFLSATSLEGQLDRSYDYLSKTENLIGTPGDNNSIAADVANLQSIFETLAVDVTSSASRYNMVSEATSLANRLNILSKEIQSLRGDADLEIEEICRNVNNQLTTISNLNDQIVKCNILGYDGAADLMDQRDEALKSLSNYIDISYYTRDNGEVVIQTSGGISLLDKEAHLLTHEAVSRAATDISYANGNINGIMVDGIDITNTIRNGQLKGLIDVRDNVLPTLQTQLDELANVMKNGLNSVHNQGTSFPGSVTTFNGTRSFIDPNTQVVNIEKGDVRFTVFDADGNQVSTASLIGDLKFSSGTLSELADEMQEWLGGVLPYAKVGFDANNKMYIDTGDSSYYLSIMDTATSTVGSEPVNATITIDNNGDGFADREFSGFSSFLGLNDFFVTSQNEYIYESNVMNKNANLGIKSQVTLDISVPGLQSSIVLGPGDTLESVADKINQNPELQSHVTASLIPNGSGYKLMITNSSGEQMEISERGQSTGFLSRIGLAPSSCNTAAAISVRDDIRVNADLLCVGSPEFDVNTGRYHLSDGNNDIANKMAKVFAEDHTFGQSGSLSRVTTTLANYASTFVGTIASQTNTSLSDKEYQDGLLSSISYQQAVISGVDSDEELANLIIYQESYAACAQVWSASKELIDILFNAI